MSPTRLTRSPTTTGVRPSSRARIAVTGSRVASPSGAQVQRPRSTAMTIARLASACSGRRLLRGREPRPGRTRTSDSSYSRALSRSARARHASALPRPALTIGREVGHGLGGAPHVVDSMPGTTSPTSAPGGGHPVVVVGAPEPAPPRSGGGRISRPSAVSVDIPAQRGELPRERGEPVGLVAAEVRDAAQPRRRVGQHGERGDHGVSSPTSCRSTSSRAACRAPDGQPVRVGRDRRAEPLQHGQDRRARLGGVLRPAGDGDLAAGDRRGGEEHRGVGQVGFDGPVARGDRAGLDPPGVRRRRRRRPRRRRAASRRTCRCAAARAPACRRGRP